MDALVSVRTQIEESARAVLRAMLKYTLLFDCNTFQGNICTHLHVFENYRDGIWISIDHVLHIKDLTSTKHNPLSEIQPMGCKGIQMGC